MEKRKQSFSKSTKYLRLYTPILSPPSLSLFLLLLRIPGESKLAGMIITSPKIKDEGNTFSTGEQSVDLIATISSHLIEVIGRPSRLHKEEPAADRKEKELGERGRKRGKWNPALVDHDKTSNFVSEVRRQSSRLAES